MQAGRSVLINANVTTDNGNLTITANDPAATAASRDPGAGGITMASGTTLNAGSGTVLLTVGSGVSGAQSGNLVVDNIIAANVNLQQTGGTSGSSILPASTSSLIQATNLLMETELAGSASGASIGTSATPGPLNGPMRVQVTNLEAHTHQSSPGIFIDSPTQGLTVGGVPFFGGVVKGVQNVASGDISIGVNGTLTLQSGAANATCGTGTGGPICTTSGNVTLRAEDMSLGHTVAGTGTVALAPYSQSRQINIEASPSGGVLSLTPAEIQNVTTAGTLEIGRSDGNATTVINTPLTSANVNASTLRLYSGNIDFTSAGGDIGSSGTPFAHNLELKANNNVQLTVGNIYLANDKSLTVVADNDSSGFGDVSIGGVTVRVGVGGNVSGNMSMTGRRINAIVSGGGSGVIEVAGAGSQTFTAAEDIIFQNANAVSGTLLVQAGSNTQTFNVATSMQVIGGGGTNTSTSVTTGSGVQVVFADSLSIQGGSTGSGNFALLNGGGGQTIDTPGGINLYGGASGGGVGVGNYALLRSQSGAQAITTSGLGLSAGTAGTENLTQVRQTSATGTQSITVTGGGSIVLQGGNGTTNYSRIINDGSSQSINFIAGGTLDLLGGSGASDDFAQIRAVTGTQTVSGSPTISLTGGPAGGLDTKGNYTQIRADSGLQTITAGTTTLQAGLGGTNNFAVIEAPSQNITVNGNLSLTGGNSVAGTIGAGARIGGLGGGSPTATNIMMLAVTGDASLTGGSLASAGSAIGSARLATPQNTDITMTVGGNLTLTGGSGSGSRIGSASTSIGGGTISVTAGGNIVLNDSTPGFGTSVRTSGSATLKTTGAASDITLGGTIDLSAGSTGVITLDAGHAIVSTGGVLIPNTSATQPMNLKAVAGIGTQANPIRFSDGDLHVLNTGTTGDIAVALVAGDAVIDGSLTGVLNSNPTGTYYMKSEIGNVQLDVPFTPNGLALAAGQSVVFTAPVGSVTINSGGSIEAKGTGNVTLSAGNTSGLGGLYGVSLGGPVSAETGTIAISGQGVASNLSSRTAGVRIGGVVQTTTGNIDINGVGGTGGVADTSRNYGVWVSGASTLISTADGAISLTGTGGSAINPSAILLGGHRGIVLENGATVRATNTGSVALNGWGGSSVDGAINSGIYMSGGNVKTVDGGITLIGHGGSSSGAEVASAGNYGLSLFDGTTATLIESGSGLISITGFGGTASNSSAAQVGINMGGTVRTTNGGSIFIEGTGGTTNGIGVGNGFSSNPGVSIFGVVQSSLNGTIDIKGHTGTSVNPIDSVGIGAFGSLVSSDAGPLRLSATGDLLFQGGGTSITTVSGTQIIDATGNIAFTASGGSVNVSSGGAQTVAAGGNLSLQGGSGTNESVLIYSAGNQNVSASQIDLAGGNAGSGNFARIYSGGNQTIGASGITVNGGLGGGISGAGNFAQIRSDGGQTINVGSGGLTLYGGSGVDADTDNFASVYQAGTTGTQTINVGSGGNIVVFGGDAAATNVDANNDHGSWAFIRADGTAQNISFSAPGAGSFLANSIQVIGGDNGSGNYAGINARNGTQSITGSPDIFVSGGSTGGISGEGNWAQIYANAGQQSITANAIDLIGGDGYENFARLWSGTQQNISAASISLFGGASGTANFAVLNAPSQNIGVTNDLMLMGGASTATATSGGGARIGGFGGTTPSATSVALNVGGNLFITGGDAENSGSAIGSGILGGQTTDVALTVTGGITLDPGTVANAGSRIGSPAASIAGGTISVAAGGNLVMNGTASGIGSAIRTTGAVSLQASSISQNTFTTIAAAQLGVTTVAGASLQGGGNQVSAFSATNTASGAIGLLNSSPTLTLTGISQVSGAAVNIGQTGNLVLPTMTFGAGTISASGTASIPSGVTFTAAGGTLTASTLDVQSGGTLNGTGTVTANVSNSGTVAPGTSAGILTVSGNYTQNSGGALTVDIGGTVPGTDYDRLAVSGTANLGGTLNLREGSVLPVAGTTYTVITYASRAGTFATVNSPTINAVPAYGATSFTLPFTSFLNSWNSSGTGAWETASNWSRGVVPGIDDDVIIDVPSSVVTIAISSSQSVRSLVTSENLTLSGGGLNLAGASTVNGSFTMSGGTLSGGGPLTVNGDFTQTGGTQTGTGGTTFGPSSTANLGAVGISRPLVNQGSLVLNGTTLLASLINSGSASATSASLGAVSNSGTFNLSGSALSGLLTSSGTVNVSGTVNASGGIQENAGLINVPVGQTLGVGGSGLVLAGGTLMGNGMIGGNVNNSAGTVAPGASPGILTINGNYTQGSSGTLAVDVGGTIAGTQYDQLVVNGNASLGGNLNTTLFGTYVPLPGDSYTFINATGTISGSFANLNQPPSLQPPVALPNPITGGSQLTVNVYSPSVPPAIAPTYNYTVVATEISGTPVENILVPVLGDTSTTTSGDTTLEKKPPACS